MNNHKRENWIDIAKGIGILLVIIGHSSERPMVLKQFIYSFHMPLFFIISGYVYNHNKWKEKGIKQLIICRFRDYIIPYFVFGFINLGLNALVEARHMTVSELIHSTIEHAFWLFYSYGSAARMPNCTALWFLPCLFLCTIYVFVLLNIENRVVRYFICLCGLGINAIVSHFAVPQLPWHIDTVLVASVFILIGYELKNAKMLTDNIMRKNFLGCIFVIGLIFTYMNTELSFNANIYGNMIFMLIGSFSLSYVCLWICTRIKKSSILSHFGRGTVIVMAFSYFFKTLSIFIWTKIPVIKDYVYAWWIESIVVIIMCYITIYIYNKFLTWIKRKSNLYSVG